MASIPFQHKGLGPSSLHNTRQPTDRDCPTGCNYIQLAS